jgi:hypothetical protein
MKKVKKKRLITLQPARSFDWPWVLFCLYVGAVGLRLGSSSRIWKVAVEKDYRYSPIGLLNVDHGKVRLKHQNSSAWQDISQPSPIFAEDRITSGVDGKAHLSLENHVALQLPPQSTLVLHAKIKLAPNYELWKNALTLFYQTDFAFRIVPEITHNDEDLSANRADAPLSRADQPEKNSAEADPPPVPEIFGPASDAEFISSTSEKEKIILRWKKATPDLEPQLEFHRIDDPGFTVHPDMLIAAASLDLPDGKYTWRLRYVGKEGHASEWSPYYRFSIQERE